MNKPNRKRGTAFIAVGALLIAAAAVLVVFNFVQAEKARAASENIVAEIAQRTASADADPAFDPNAEMPEAIVNGLSCIGTVEIPTLKLRLPILSDWSYPNLKKSPCRYSGSVYSDDLVIAAHNYRNHFGKISKLHNGDPVTITDLDGRTFAYRVDVVDVLNPADIDEMNSGVWPLTLFTCTVGGSYRVTVRCEKCDE